MCNLKDMNFISVFNNAIVVELMAIYVYQNEIRMEEIASKHNRTGREMLTIGEHMHTKSAKCIIYLLIRVPCL